MSVYGRCLFPACARTYFCCVPMEAITFVECPRDAMQGWPRPIATADKVRYLNALLAVGFPVLDCGSFVSPKAIPQMADTAEVLDNIAASFSASELLVIVANTRGAEEAVKRADITYLGFPFSISETFQQRNTNKSIAESLAQVKEIQRLCEAHDKRLVVYISMGFGNPYGDPYSPDVAADWTGQLAALGIRTIALSDTVGMAQPEAITKLFSTLVPQYADVAIGAHFHSTHDSWQEKLDAAYQGGCRRFDSAIGGIGGCPMAKDDLVGNIATEKVLRWAADHGLETGVNADAFAAAKRIAAEIFI